MYKYSVNKNWQRTDDQYHHELVDQSGQWPENYNIYWRFTIHFKTLMMTFTQVVKTSVSATTNKPSQDYTHPHDHTPPTYDNYDLWVQTIYINGELASKKWSFFFKCIMPILDLLNIHPHLQWEVTRKSMPTYQYTFVSKNLNTSIKTSTLHR